MKEIIYTNDHGHERRLTVAISKTTGLTRVTAHVGRDQLPSDYRLPSMAKLAVSKILANWSAQGFWLKGQKDHP